MHPLGTNDRLILYLDLKSPYAYLAKQPAYDLERDFGISIDWRPLTLNIPSFLGSATVNERREVVEESRTPRQWQSVRYAYTDVKRYARVKDIRIYGPRKIWDTRLAHIGWLFAKRHGRDVLYRYLDEMYERFWLREIDVEELSTIQSILHNAGAPEADFEEFIHLDGGRLHDQLQASLHPTGIFGVPTFVLDDEIYFGRENLPLIRWILGGREGQAPDVAYTSFSSAA